MTLFPRNANDALIRAGCDTNAKVHLHIDEVEGDLQAFKLIAQAEALEAEAESINNPNGYLEPVRKEFSGRLLAVASEKRIQAEAMTAPGTSHGASDSAECIALRKRVARLEAELENRSNEEDMLASDAYHHCADIIEPYVGDRCGPTTLSNSVCDSLRFLLNEWQKQNGDLHANGK